jgi:hypothetical protein
MGNIIARKALRVNGNDIEVIREEAGELFSGFLD